MVRLEPWGDGDLPLVQQLMGDPAMTEHFGGPESAEKLADRQHRYRRLADSGNGRMLKIVDDEGSAAGSVGYWEKDWRGGQIWEIGWMVLPAFQGRGIAGRATERAIALARADRKHRFLHAFPSVENAPSNAICRKLGSTLLGECDFEFPPGHRMRCNDWQLDLEALPIERRIGRRVSDEGAQTALAPRAMLRGSSRAMHPKNKGAQTAVIPDVVSEVVTRVE